MFDRPGAERVDAHAAAGELDAELAREREHAALRGGVGDLRGRRAHHRHERRGVDHRAAAAPRAGAGSRACSRGRPTRRLTSCTRCHASSDVSSTEASSSGEMPALLNSTSIRPYSLARARVHVARPAPRRSTSACDREVARRRRLEVDADDRRALRARTAARVSAPMPLAAPVITQTLPSSRPHQPSRRVVDVLELGVVRRARAGRARGRRPTA